MGTRLLLLALVCIGCHLVSCLPLSTPLRRASQTLTAATTKWKAACTSAGGGIICDTLAQTAAVSLAASAGSCDQQDTADKMINLAHNLGSPQDLITYTQIYVQQSRNSEDNSSVVYCQKAPANVELQGLYQCQFNSSSRTTFTGGLKLGGKGTMPFGFTSPLDPAGGCPAHPGGPIADGAQLTDLTNDPGLKNIRKARTASSSLPILHKTAVSGAPRPSLTLRAV